MAGQIKLFEKTSDGLLLEVDPANADEAMRGRLRRRVALQCDVLFTAEEEAERRAEEAAALVEHEAEAAAKRKRNADLEGALAKLKSIGLSSAEINALTGR